MTSIRVLQDASAVRYSNGAKAGDTGGVRQPRVSPMFANWASCGDVPPAGIGSDYECSMFDFFIYNNTAYGLIRSIQGTGRGLYLYSINQTADPVSISYSQMKTMAELGLAPFWWWGDVNFVDYSTGEIVLCSYNNASAPISLGKWDLDDGVPTSGNAKWLIGPTSYGSVILDKITFIPVAYIDKTNNRIYVASYNSGKINTFRYTDGAYLGEWQYNSTYAATYSPQIFGVYPGTTDVLMGSYFHNGNVYRWDASDPTNWIQGAKVFDAANSTPTTGSARPYVKMPNNLHGLYIRIFAMTRETLNILGKSSTTIGWMTFWPTLYGVSYGARYMCFYDFNTSEYYELEASKGCSYTRSGNKNRNGALNRITYINNNLWFIYPIAGTIDHFAEEATLNEAGGIAAMQASRSQVEYDHQKTYTFTPKKMTIELMDGIDVESSTHPGKHQVTLQIGVQTYGPRAGDELLKLDQVVNGKPAWPSIPANTTFTLIHEMQSGILENFVNIQGNPGDVTTPTVPINEIGPIWDIELVLDVEKEVALIGL